MARVNFPDSFAQQQALLGSVSGRHTADSDASVLHPYFTEQKINIDSDVATGAQAEIHEKARGLYSKQAEGYRQLRDNGFDAVWSRTKGMVQYLKGLYRGKERQLGDWGITVDGKSRITYPTDFDSQAKLFTTFRAKHDEYKDTPSPLAAYLTTNSVNLVNDAAAVKTAQDNHTAMGDAQKKAEDEKELRDNLWNPVAGRLRGMVDFLKKLYRDNPKALGGYGVMVDDSPRAPRLRNTALKIGEHITVNGVSIGGTLTNTGAGDLHVYRGKTTTGTPSIVHAGEQLGMLKGWSIITVVNPSTTVAGKFSVLCVNTH